MSFDIILLYHFHSQYTYIGAISMLRGAYYKNSRQSLLAIKIQSQIIVSVNQTEVNCMHSNLFVDMILTFLQNRPQVVYIQY